MAETAPMRFSSFFSGEYVSFMVWKKRIATSKETSCFDMSSAWKINF